MIDSQKIVTGIDIVIPSYRLRDEFLLPILQLQDHRVHLHIYLIANNPFASISPTLCKFIDTQPHIKLIACKSALGFSASRNSGIVLGKQEWVLLLDDDIMVSPHLLSSYIDKLLESPDAIGFSGLVEMPKPFNSVTTALSILGVATHFEKPKHSEEVVWTPTANVLLKRSAIPERLFDESLVFGGEDIDLLSEMSLNAVAKFICVPEASAIHPWWNNGNQQHNRLFNYGRASIDVMDKKHVRPFTYLDFPNASELSLLVMMTMPFLIFTQFLGEAIAFFLIVWMAETLISFATCFAKKEYSVLTTLMLTTHNAARQIGAITQIIYRKKWSLFSRRLDAGFQKINPSPFRLNRWKIGRGLLLLLGILLMVAIRTSL